MPDIAVAGTVTKDTLGFSGLKRTSRQRAVLLAGTTIGTTCLVQYTDDTGTLRTFEDGTITTLPDSLDIKANTDITIVTTGSPDLNVTIVTGK